jgi:hypothetical protein
MRRDQDIKLSNGCSSLGKHATDSAELGCCVFVEWHNLDGGRERVNKAVESPRSLSGSSISKFSERDRADAEVRWIAFSDAHAHVTLTSKRIADTVRVKKVFHDSKGFLLDATLRTGGLGMSSCHAPRQARNSSGHSSAGSRMTCFPTFRTITWS